MSKGEHPTPTNNMFILRRLSLGHPSFFKLGKDRVDYVISLPIVLIQERIKLILNKYFYGIYLKYISRHTHYINLKWGYTLTIL